MRVHVFQPDPENGPDWKGEYRCQCGMPRQHEAHHVPDRSEDDVSDRIVGEAETVDR